jgi:hypothetical protein
MKIDELDWDDNNIEHIARHGVTPQEVEDVCYGFHIYSILGKEAIDTLLVGNLLAADI